MSINQASSDMVHINQARDMQAKYAGEVIYRGISQDSITVDMDRNDAVAVNNIASSSGEETLPEGGRMTAVRRTFCLLTAFDLILTFIIWVIYTQLIGDVGWDAFEKQVANYDFRFSLFDTVMLSAVRVTFLLLAYALFRLNHWIMVAITTFMTCAFLIVKIFLFKFSFTNSAKNPLSYVLIIISFVMAWVETWFLDFKVLPQEKKMRARAQARGPGVTDERTPLLHDRVQHQYAGGDENQQYYSPIDTPEGSDDELERPRDRFHSARASRSHTRQPSWSSVTSSPAKEQDYPKLAQKAWNSLWDLLNIPDKEWKHETGSSVDTGIVHSRHEQGVGKVFRLQGSVNMNSKELWDELVFRISESPKWNPTVTECKILQVLDDNSDISYNVAAEAGGGLVSSRDFVSLRRWGYRDGYYLAAGIAAVHPGMPHQKKFVRGENGPGGWAFKDVPGVPDQCIFFWFLNTNLKGWLPQKLIDQTLAGVQLDYLKYVRQRINLLKGLTES